MFVLDDLPSTLPIFPLSGAILLPKGHLPLNVFEGRYLEMVHYARAGNGLIGMIQPQIPHGAEEEGDDMLGTARRNRPLYKTGCVGMISDFDEKDDGRVELVLTGLCRFDMIRELPKKRLFREAEVSYARFGRDCAEVARSDKIDRKRLVLTIEAFLKRQGISAHWETFETACDEELINSFAMICPFEPAEKQALLETVDLRARLEMMIQIMAFSLSGSQAAYGEFEDLKIQ